MMDEKQNDSARLPRFGIPKVLPYLKNLKKAFLILLVTTFLGGVIDTFFPILQRYALNHFVGENTLDTLPVYISVFILTILVMSVNCYINLSAAIRFEVNINQELRAQAFQHLQTLSFSFFNQNSVGYIHARVMSDASRIGEIFAWGIAEGFWMLVYFLTAIVVMLAVNARLAFYVILVLPVAALLFSVFQKKLVLLNRRIREKNSIITGDINEGITGARTIKTLVIEKLMGDHFRKDTAEMRQYSVKAARIRGCFAVTMHTASSLALAVVLWKGGLLAKEEIGTFSLFMTYAEGIMEPLRWVVDFVSDLITTQVNIERLTRILETVPDVHDRPEVVERYGDTFEPKKENWEPLYGDIEFRDVDFKYPDGDEYVLEQFNLKIPYGTNVAIVGETGAGKSTLANLICRFFEPTRGAVLIDGRDARERSQLWLHSNLGYVLQTPQMFSGTVRDNLLYGNPEATEEQLLEAIHLVSADAVIEKLDQGLDTDIGEGGDLLSTGEKQLISFARAILADPRILVLDEATASVDTVTEQKIQSAIETVIRGRTSIVIAHRLSTIRNADMILVVRDGKIMEQGTHRELIQKGHYYCNLYTRQYRDEATAKLLS